jgi:hybrid cluster-associated redox disulfide protein
MTIDAKMTIAEIIRQQPEAAKVLQKFGMHCIGCAVAAGESLEDAARVHEIDLQELLKALQD